MVLLFKRDEAGIAHAPAAAAEHRKGLSACHKAHVAVCCKCPFRLAVLCTARFVAQTTKIGGTRPGRRGGEFVWPQFRFFPGWPNLAVGEEAPGSRPVHGSSDRTGTDKGWYSKA